LLSLAKREHLRNIAAMSTAVEDASAQPDLWAQPAKRARGFEAQAGF